MTSRDLTAWAADFARRHNLDLTRYGFDERLGQQYADKATTYADENIPARFADAVVDNPAVDAWLAETVRRAVAKSAAARQQIISIHSGPSLLLLGATGTTKTSQCCGAMRGLAALGIFAGWVKISTPDLYARLRPRHGVDAEAEFRAVAGAPILILEELGLRFNAAAAEANTTPFVEEVNYRIVDYRYERMLPTLFTSNLRAKDLARVLGDRVSSRLNEMTSRVVLDGPDRRYRGAA